MGQPHLESKKTGPAGPGHSSGAKTADGEGRWVAVVCSPVTPFNWVVSERRGTQQNQQQNYLRESRRAEGTQFAANLSKLPAAAQRAPKFAKDFEQTLGLASGSRD